MQVKKQQLEPDMEQQTGLKLGKEYVKSVYCLSAYLTYAEYIMRNAGLEDAHFGIKISGRNINNLRYPGEISITSDMKMIPPLWQKVKRN